ncbi:Lactamase_B domain-containing protein [Tenacibaculum sp. 190130A14a]|uniref:Competence protein ComEC n=1 Tax=Tenacibaculum polynesiense TaxID=3137857 RepID=A0ABP1F0S1_9FLAO
MGNKLLIRSYNVGCGDCFYVRIPNNDDGFHILIDCGSKEGINSGVLDGSIKHLEEHMLPTVSGSNKKRLDLIVVTHRHEDHIKGFDPKFFKNIEIENIWITAAMNEQHPQAKKTLALNGLVEEEIIKLKKDKVNFSPELRNLVGLYGIRNKGATKALTQELPNKNGISVDYVHAGLVFDHHKLNVEDDTKITVLAPEKDIDHFYLGKDIDRSLKGFTEVADTISKHPKSSQSAKPTNINGADFRTLKARMVSNALAFAVDDSSIQNNVSTVLLIEWCNNRLLFVGDAEWHGEFKAGKKNGSWNVMWKERKDLLNKPIDFLKAGHHGSFNATPWNRDEDSNHEVNQIFDAILPKPLEGEEPTALCLVSTKRKQYVTIPDAELLVELGKRVGNTKNYHKSLRKEDSTFNPETDIYNYSIEEEYTKPPSPREVGEKEWFNNPQPLRTDMESKGRGSKTMFNEIEFVDVEISPK